MLLKTIDNSNELSTTCGQSSKEIAPPECPAAPLAENNRNYLKIVEKKASSAKFHNEEGWCVKILLK